MSSVVTHPAVDVTIAGLGFMSGPVAVELALAGYKVVGIEKGPYLDFAVDFAETRKFDEWGTSFSHKYDHKLAMWSYTVRNDRTQFANPVRRYTKSVATVPEGHEVGGMGVHYGAGLGRYIPWTYQARSSTINKYGEAFLRSISPHYDFEDYPFTYDQLVPYYKEWERSVGVSGTNQEPFAPDSAFPSPPHPDTPLGKLWQTTATSLGYYPYPSVSGIVSKPYVNQYGVPINGCAYDGWCTIGGCNGVCETGAKVSSHVNTIPPALKTGNFDLRTECTVFRVNLDSTGKTATGVSYYDAAGSVHVQPSKVVYVTMWVLASTRMLLLSGIGKPYNPVTATGVTGRGMTIPPASSSSASGTLNMGGNAYPAGSAGGGYSILDFSGDFIDHKGLNFIGGGGQISFGGYLGGSAHTIDIVSPGENNFGSAYKASLKDNKLPTKLSVSSGPSGIQIPDTDHFADLDPHYTDMFGDPLLRMTLDNTENSLNASDYLAPIMASTVLPKLGATNISVRKTPHSQIAHWDRWSAHERGGARMGSNPQTSVFNKWMQSWDVPNLFSVGEHNIMLGDNVTAGTHGIGPLSYVAVDGIKKYLESPGPLV